ncbi:MAG TPA: isoprenylcysteine carboxylmethyltransferase family protein [Bdellovibrionota bacterium]|nr:isoprenylcysteine carboxylmethyltransferase family protein [Bdellovibrionota bacterium]
MEHPVPAVIYTVFDVLYFVIRVYWAMLVPLVALYAPWLDRFDYPESLAVPLSIPMLLAGLVVFWLAHRDLVENWSVTLELKEGHSLVTTGIYRRIRHPMYTAIWLCAIMLEKFGDEYRAYMARTGRLTPFV